MPRPYGENREMRGEHSFARDLGGRARGRAPNKDNREEFQPILPGLVPRLSLRGAESPTRRSNPLNRAAQEDPGHGRRGNPPDI